MATIINTPSTKDSSDSGLGIIVGVIIAIALIALFFVYGLPAIREGKNDSTNINVTVPNPIGGGSGDTSGEGSGGGDTGGTGL